MPEVHTHHNAAQHVHDFNPMAGRRNPLDHVCPTEGCNVIEYMARRRGGCAKCRGVGDTPTTIRMCECGCGRRFATDNPARLYYDRQCKNKAEYQREQNARMELDATFLRAFIADRGYSITALGEAMGRNRSWMSRILNQGYTERRHLPRLAEVLGVDQEVLLK